MDERFLELGKKRANKIACALNVEADEPLIDFCKRYEYLWYMADMSDDYSKTLSEQAKLLKDLELETNLFKARKFI